MIQIIRLSERPSSGASWLVTVFPPTSEAPKLHAYGLSPERVQCSMLFLGNDGVASAILSGQPGQKTGSAGPRPPVAADCQIRAHPPPSVAREVASAADRSRRPPREQPDASREITSSYWLCLPLGHLCNLPSSLSLCLLSTPFCIDALTVRAVLIASPATPRPHAHPHCLAVWASGVGDRGLGPGRPLHCNSESSLPRSWTHGQSLSSPSG